MTDSSRHPDIRADLRDVNEHASWREVRHALHLPGDGGHK